MEYIMKSVEQLVIEEVALPLNALRLRDTYPWLAIGRIRPVRIDVLGHLLRRSKADLNHCAREAYFLRDCEALYFHGPPGVCVK